MFEEENDLLTRADVQRLLQISKCKALNLISDGHIPAYVIANSYRIRKEDLLTFIERTKISY